MGRNDLDAAADLIKAATISDADLWASSLQMMKQMDARNPVAKGKNKYAQRLANLTKNLTNEDGLNLNFKAYLIKDVNAFATPDGSVRVFAGLMDLMTDGELLSVIGHEIGHVKLGHSLKAARTAYLSSAAAKAAGSRLNAAALTDLGVKFVNAQFSQSQESDSDAYGVAFLKRHKFKLPPAETAMLKLADLDGTAAGGSSSLFASHPGSKDRAKKIHDLISK
ncbi:MAG: M48 family metalloprotease [Azoarcus sp.]|nr:M48 family metalloprotease [Azoarcus sp.]